MPPTVPAGAPRARRGWFALAAATLLGLAACAPQPSRPVIGSAPPIAPAAPVTRAALLLPLSGAQAPLGQAMLNASTMALFDEAPSGVEFAPLDTGGTPAGAANAARQAIAGGARAIIGPLTSAEAASVLPVARAAGVPVLAFTNDPQRAGEGAWVLGTTPQQQVRRIVAAAARDGAQRFVLAAPSNEFGRLLAIALRGATSDLGLPAPAISLHPSGADPAMAASAARAASPQADAVLLGENGDRARRFAAAYVAEAQAAPPAADGGSPPIGRILGTALWLTDAGLRGEEALANAIFPGPDPGARSRFETRYRDAFRETPPRVAAAAYDAAALAARALRANAPLGTVTSWQSFAGADGPVRLLPDGRTLRGLAVYGLSPSGEPFLVEGAVEPGGPGS
jgi:ABC-type branched-subunit amino acid transport system substrate-binding protein